MKINYSKKRAKTTKFLEKANIAEEYIQKGRDISSEKEFLMKSM